MNVPEELLAILVCPVCHAPVHQIEAELECTGCGLRYPVDDGIPVMLPESARPRPAGAGS